MEASSVERLETHQPRRGEFAAPIWTLLILSPIIAEVLSGSTRTSILFVLIPEIMVWGVGALLCRELVRRWHAGAGSLVLLGLALSIAEEFLIQQTSIAPLPFPGSHAEYGRIWGINLVYFLFMLGYESVWVVLVPVQVTELIFPDRRDSPWLRRGGWIACCATFLVGSRIAWYGWTQQARPRLHAAPYHPPVALVASGVLAVVLLIGLAYLLRRVGRVSSHQERATVPAWVGGIAAFVLGAAWFSLIGQNFVPNPVQPSWKVLAAGALWASLAAVLFAWWTSRRGWRDVHRWAACFGATLACEVMPYATARSWPKVDLVGKMIFDVVAVTGFVVLARRIFRSNKAQPAMPVA